MNPKWNEKAHNLSAPLNQIAEADNGRFSPSLPFLGLSLSVTFSLSPLSSSEKQHLHFKTHTNNSSNKTMLACPSSSLHGLATLQRHSQPSHFLLSNSLFFPPSHRLAASRKCNFRSLHCGRSSCRYAFRASADSPEVSESVVGDSGVLQPYSVKIPVGDRHVSLFA